MATRFERIYSDLCNDLEYIKDNYYGNNLSSAFGHFILKMKFGLNDDEAFDCITDGYDDNGIDAIYIEDDKTVHFFQFKFPSEVKGIGNGISENEVLKLSDGFKSFVSDDEEFNLLQWNELLKDKRAEFLQYDIYDFKLWIVKYSNQQINNSTNAKMNRFVNSYIKETGNELSAHYLFADECVSLYEKNIKNVWPNFKLKYKKTLSPFSDDKSTINSAFVSLEEIYNTFYSIQDKIYEGNVRYLNPNSKINEGIKKTILTNRENFHLLNNGITIVCKKCNDNTAQSYLDIDGGSIINGAQTVGTIISTISEIDESSREIYNNSFVFVRIISMNSNEEIINDMVYTLNTQNQMKSSYTISNDLIVKNVQQRINNETDYYLEIKNNEFNFEKVKDPKFNKLAKNKIDIETFIQIYVSFYNISNLANTSKNNKSILFENNNIKKIINELDFEKGLYAYEIYLKLMDIIKDYRAYRKNHEKKEIMNILMINEDEIDDYKYLNTGNIIIMYALGVLRIEKQYESQKHIIDVIKYLKDYFKNTPNISNATKIKESFDAVRNLIIKYEK